MKIAVVVSEFPLLSETFVQDQITGLLDRGHDPRIYVTDFASHGRSEPTVHPEVKAYRLLQRTRYRTMPARRGRRIAGALGILTRLGPRFPRGCLRALNPFRYGRRAYSLKMLYTLQLFEDAPGSDVVHCHFGPNGNLALEMKRLGLLTAPMVTSFHGYDAWRYVHRRSPDVYRDLFEHGDLFTANSRFLAQRLTELGCPPERLVVHPEGLPLARWPRPESAQPDGAPLTLLSVARLVEQKGLVYSIRAVAKLLKERPDLQYLIAGDGPQRPRLERQIAQLGAAKSIRLLGYKNRDQLKRLYARADLFVLPSVADQHGGEESQGLVLQEAQANELPVVSTRTGGIPEGVLDGETGLLVEPRNPPQLTDAIRRLLDDPERRRAMGRRGREWIEQHFSIERLNDRLCELLASVQPDREHVDRPGDPRRGRAAFDRARTRPVNRS